MIRHFFILDSLHAVLKTIIRQLNAASLEDGRKVLKALIFWLYIADD